MNSIYDCNNILTNLHRRRQKLAQLIKIPVILWSGNKNSRNFPSNCYPFRANSHFLYFAGMPLENAAIRLWDGKLELFIDNSNESDSLWHGKLPQREEIAEKIGANNAYPLRELSQKTHDAATIAVQDAKTYEQQCQLLNRQIPPPNNLHGVDLELGKAIVELRLNHDEAALKELRKAISIAKEAHLAGMRKVKTAKTEAEVRGAIENIIISENMTCAYNSIVTVRGEVLHNEHYSNFIQDGDLLLVDAGAETANGWASDLTRTFPVNGKFSPTQRDIYNVVLASHDACIEKIKPEIEYRVIHLQAALTLAEGLVDLGILRGNPQDLVEMDAHALFFPHGVGHLLGLDVHDMEDLGDLAGYAPERTRSDRFGLAYLRLDRPLKTGMLVTIEPGFYQVHGILNNKKFREKYQDVVNWDQIEKFADVKGIRIEDDVLVTESGHQVLSDELPNSISEIELIVNS